MEALFCVHCGAKLVENARFCVKCGNSVPRMEETEEIQTPAAVLTPEIVAAQPEIVAAQPEIIETQPEIIASQPEIIETQPEIIAAQPEVVTAQPEIVATPVVLPEEPAREVAPAKKKEKKEKKLQGSKMRRGVGRTMLAVLICTLLFVLSTVTILLSGLHSLTAENSVKELVGDLVEEVDSIPASLFAKNAEDDASVIDLFAEYVQRKGTKLRAKDIEKFVTEPTFIEVLSEEICTYLSDIRNNEKEAILNEKAIRNLLKEHSDLIEDTLGIRMTDQSRKTAAENAEKSGALEYTDAKLLKQKVPAAYYGIQYGLSIWVLCILGGLLLLFVLLLGSTNRWGFIRTSGDLGITLTVSGALIALPSAVGMLGIESLFGSLPAVGIICVAVEHLSRHLVLCAACALGLGILLILLSNIVKKIVAKRRAKVAV